jgi:hypothetical protein
VISNKNNGNAVKSGIKENNTSKENAEQTKKQGFEEEELF